MITAIICTYNPCIRLLQDVIDSINNQTQAKEIVEITIVDNNSNMAVKRLDLKSQIRLMHVQEPRQGLVYARIAGIENCKSDWVLFIDDDNMLDPLYVENALCIISDNPQLGVLGAGNIVPKYEKSPNIFLTPYLNYLALRENKKSSVSNDPLDKYTPWGAGLIVNKYIAKEWCKFMMDSNLDFGRVGRNLLGGEDIIFSVVAKNNNFIKGIFDNLKLIHFIPAQRLEKQYLLNLVYGTTLSGLRINRLLDDDFRPYLYSLNSLLFDYFCKLSNFKYHGKLKSVRLLKDFFVILRKNKINNQFVNSKNKAVLEFLKNG
jgi:glycosyltransferase involved in cell wall biosynthesis